MGVIGTLPSHYGVFTRNPKCNCACLYERSTRLVHDNCPVWRWPAGSLDGLPVEVIVRSFCLKIGTVLVLRAHVNYSYIPTIRQSLLKP